MTTPEPEEFEKEVVSKPDGRRLVLYRFTQPPAPPAGSAPLPPPPAVPAREER